MIPALPIALALAGAGAAYLLTKKDDEKSEPKHGTGVNDLGPGKPPGTYVAPGINPVKPGAKPGLPGGFVPMIVPGSGGKTVLVPRGIPGISPGGTTPNLPGLARPNVPPILEGYKGPALVVTFDPPPMGDLIIREAPSLTAKQTGGAEKNGVVQVLDATPDADGIFAKVQWSGGSRWPAATGYVRKQFLTPVAYQQAATEVPGGTVLEIPGGDTIFGKENALLKPTLPKRPAGTKSVGEYMRSQAPALASARQLFAYLKSHGVDHSSTLKGLVASFQKQANLDKSGIALHGPLNTTGVYDLGTSAALTLYTGEPIFHDTHAAPPRLPTVGEVLTSKNPGPASLAAYNLAQYLRKHQYSVADTKLAQFVKEFQHYVNVDPSFPGPAYAVAGKPKRVTKLLKEDGDYGKPGSATRAAHYIYHPPGIL